MLPVLQRHGGRTSPRVMQHKHAIASICCPFATREMEARSDAVGHPHGVHAASTSCSQLPPSPRAIVGRIFSQASFRGLSTECDFALLMLGATVAGGMGGGWRCWWSQRTNRIRARAARCSARHGRLYGAIYSPPNRCSKCTQWGYTRRMRLCEHAHVRAMSCTGGGLLGRDVGSN